MKYVSEITNLIYDSAEDCQAAEKEYLDKQAKATAEKEKKANERAKRAKEVEKAYEAVVNANKEYKKILDSFIADYGSFHMTYTDSNNLISDLFDSLFRLP